MKNLVLPYLNLEAPALRQIGFRLAKVDGVNLAQGLCLMPTPELIIDAARRAMLSGKNTYSPANGVPELRAAIAGRLNSFNKIPAKESNVVVTSGSTGAFEAVCQSFLDIDDEVIAFTPFYPYHHNAILRRQAKARYVELKRPGWTFNIADIEKAVSPRSKLLLLISPHNPTGKMFSAAELEQIAQLCKKHDLLCVTDEVYEYITYDDRQHISMASLPGMFERTVTMSSYSKTFAITGWRIGYLAAPDALAEVLKTTFDQAYVCAPTPLQHAVAEGIQKLGSEFYDQNRTAYTRKREILSTALLKAGFDLEIPQGAYYIVANTTKRFPGKSSEQVSDELVERAHVGAVPASDFIGPQYKGDAKASNFLRFSYSVPDELLERAGQALLKL